MNFVLRSHGSRLFTTASSRIYNFDPTPRTTKLLLSKLSTGLSRASLSGSRFHSDYAPTDVIPDSSDSHARNQSLVASVQKEHYAAAERIRLHLVSECAPIEPNPVYEWAALAQIRRHGKQDLPAFLTWLDLVPDNKAPSRVQNGPMTKTRNILFHTGTPARNLRLISEFSLVCAAKGYGQLVWDDLVRLMVGFQTADKAVTFFLSFETALLQYYSKYHPSLLQETASRQRSLLIMLCCDAEWFDTAVQLVRDSNEYRINRAYDRLVVLLGERNDFARLALLKQHPWKRRSRDAFPSQTSIPDPPQEVSSMRRIAQLLTGRNSSETSLRPRTHVYSTRLAIHDPRTQRPRPWIAFQLRHVKKTISDRSLVYYRPPGDHLHSVMGHYEACNGRPRGLLILRKRALSVSDLCSYTWLCKEMFYLRESRKFGEIVTLFGANFDIDFLPHTAWDAVQKILAPTDPLLIEITVPDKLQISPADAWIIWNALVRLSVYLPDPIPVLEALHLSVLHYSSKLTDRQFRAFPTSYTAVFRSIIWAYGECHAVDKAKAAAGDISLIGKANDINVGHLDELAAVYARSGDVRAASRLLRSLEKGVAGPRLATYGVMMDAYLQAGLIDEASELELRMKKTCQYVPGVNFRMDITLKNLRAAEDALDPEMT
ncbi:hypothetical protein C8J57DRAFT_323086 [Mycena rebaudengoi]|nr:hypothetical protein C8J57DRAFT_323086 [Mycena rebaudengoi]